METSKRIALVCSRTLLSCRDGRIGWFTLHPASDIPGEHEIGAWEDEGLAKADPMPLIAGVAGGSAPKSDDYGI